MKVMWAFEPFHQDSSRIKGMHELLKQIAGSATNIDLGFVVTRTEGELNRAFDVPYEERYGAYPRKLLKEVLRRAKVPLEDKRIHVVDFETFSNTKAVDRLLALAKSRDSGIVALYTHARKGLGRFFLGSFAETAIHRSKVSLLLANPKIIFSSKLKNIFFASDFTSASKKHLNQVIRICRQVKAKLTVFHHADAILKWSLDENNPKIHAYRRKVKAMQSWVEQECRKSDVPCAIIVNSELNSTSDLAIKTASKTKADLIVVAAKSGSMTALMGGSITRQLVRASKKPVWVLK